MVEMLVFDVDGTLFDTLPGIYDALEEVFEKYSVGFFDRANGMRFIGPPIKESLKKYEGLSDTLAENATLYYREVYVEKHIAKSSLYDGVLELIADLKKEGYGISIATMKTRNQVERLLDVTTVDKQLFDFVETALDNGDNNKSEMLTKIKSESGNDFLVMIGDTEGDRKAAEEAQVKFIGVTYGYGFRPDKKYDFPVVNNVDELSAAIKGLSKGINE